MPGLYDKIYGCLAASRVGSAMGAAVEGWSPERIQETYGYVDRFHSYLHYSNRGVTWQTAGRHDRGRHRAPEALLPRDHREAGSGDRRGRRPSIGRGDRPGQDVVHDRA